MSINANIGIWRQLPLVRARILILVFHKSVRAFRYILASIYPSIIGNTLVVPIDIFSLKRTDILWALPCDFETSIVRVSVG